MTHFEGIPPSTNHCKGVTEGFDPFIAGWWFRTWILFFHSVGIFIIPTDELHHFSEG
jgi:hypothetical protein